MHCQNGCDVSGDRVMREQRTQVLRCGWCGEKVHECSVEGCKDCKLEETRKQLRHDGNTVLL